MRKRTMAIIAAIITCTLLRPCRVLAEMQLPYGAHTVLSVYSLTPEQRALAEYLYQPLMRGEARITLPEGTSYDDVSTAMNSLLHDYPELFHVHYEYSVAYLQNHPDVAIALTPRYRMDVAQANLVRDELYAVARDMAAMYGGDPLALHDALVAHVTYGGSTELRHTAAGALLYGSATCEGYAQGLTLLYRFAGIPCGMVTGSAVDMYGCNELHAWNIADLDGYTLIDATWNDQGHLGLNTHWYYGLSTAQMGADHTPDSFMDVPACGDGPAWHRRQGREIDSPREAYVLMGWLARSGEPFNARIADPELYQAVSGDVHGFILAYNDQCDRGDAFVGSYAYLTCDAQQCIIIIRTED